MSKDKFMKKSFNFIIEQEKIINELRTFIEIFLCEMLDLVEQEQAGVGQRYLQEVGEVLPDTIEKDPFALFTLYKSQVSRENRNTVVEDLQEELDFLKEQLQFKEEELVAFRNICLEETTKQLKDDLKIKELEK